MKMSQSYRFSKFSESNKSYLARSNNGCDSREWSIGGSVVRAARRLPRRGRTRWAATATTLTLGWCCSANSKGHSELLVTEETCHVPCAKGMQVLIKSVYSKKIMEKNAKLTPFPGPPEHIHWVASCPV